MAAGKPRDSHNPGQIYCEESFGEDEATEKTPWNKARAGASKPETSASSSGDDHSLLMQLMAKIETLEASQQSLAREPRTGAQARQDEAGEKRPEEAGSAAEPSTRREEAEPLRRERPEASPEDTASSSSWARQKERGDPTPSELPNSKSATNRRALSGRRIRRR